MREFRRGREMDPGNIEQIDITDKQEHVANVINGENRQLVTDGPTEFERITG
jgi:hypothetical protein